MDCLEYLVVILSLIATMSVGLYFSREGKHSVQEYMLGSRKMTAIPISLSIAATYLSGSSMLSTSQEVYTYGLQWWYSSLNYLILGILAAYVFLPVSYNVKSASTFEFFHRRYNGVVRKYASIIYALETILHTAMSQYIPAVSLSQATGLPAFPIACCLSFICWVYSGMGGLKAVTYADSVQAILFFVCVVVLFFVGITMVGGFWEVWQTGVDGSRMEFFDFSMRYDARFSVPVAVIGGWIILLRAFVAPSFHQRVVAMPTYEQAKQVTLWSSIFTAVFLLFTHLMGMVVYSYFHGCDPLLAGKDIHSYATILPYFVGEISKKIPGLTGIFFAGVIAAGLSTTTSCWNTVACTFYEDLVKPYLGCKTHSKTAVRIVQMISLLVAVISTSFILVIENTTSLMETTITLKSFADSGSFVLHICGMVFPWINAKGAVTGSLAAALLTCYVAIGSQWARNDGLVVNVPKILTTANCVVNGTTLAALNQTISIGSSGFGIHTVAHPSVPWYFRMSMIVYNVPGAFVGLVVAFLVSAITGFEDLSTIDPRMIIPQMRWVLPEEKRLADFSSEQMEGAAMIMGNDEVSKKNMEN